MIIEILDGQGAVITKVANVTDPQREVSDYGGASWREYVEPEAITTEKLRRSKISATRAEGLTRIGAIIPALKNEATLDLMVELFQAGAFVAGFPAPGSDMERVKDIYVYTKQKIATAKTATKDQLEAYDPATDTGWPT